MGKQTRWSQGGLLHRLAEPHRPHRHPGLGAFFAVVSIGVVGLYLAFAVPIYYRWKAGDGFAVGKWNLRGHHKWMAPLAVIEIIVTSIIALFPTSIGGVPWIDGFGWKCVNYTPLLVGGVLILLYIYWHASVKKWFTGPIKQVDATGEWLEGVS